MFSNRMVLSLGAGLLLLCVPPLRGQAFRGGISGSVHDASGGAMPGATVKIEHAATGLRRSMITSARGDFVFPDLPTGSYTVWVSHPGFETKQIRNLAVEVGTITSLPVTLNVGQQIQTLEASATGARLETREASLNAVVNTRAIQDIPLNGRDYTQLLTLTPGSNRALSQNGSRSNQNNWMLDGVDNNDLWDNSQATNQSATSMMPAVLLPIDAIEESNQQSVGGADFGRNPGSQVNVAIKSGTNRLHGSLYYFHRNEALAADNPFSPPGTPSKLRNHNFGGSVGGPMIKDKAFLFLSYEGQRFVAGQSSVATVPSDAWVAKGQVVLAKYNVPVNPVMTNLLANLWPNSIRNTPGHSLNFVSGDNNELRNNNFVGRIDLNLTPRNRFFIRSIMTTGEATAYSGSVYRDYFQAVPTRQENWAAVMTSSLTPRLVNQVLVGVNYLQQSFDDANHSADPPALGLNTGVTSFNFGTPSMELAGFRGGGWANSPTSAEPTPPGR